MQKILLLTIALATASTALAADYAITAKIGTLGLGLDLTRGVTETVNIRLNGNYFSYNYDDDIESVSYDADLDLATVGLLADWHPFKNGFRVSGGLYYNGIESKATGTPTEGTYEINDTLYDAGDIGTLEASIELGSSIAPYLGVGWGNAIDKEGKWSFSLDVGVLITGSPDASANVTGVIANDPDFQSDLQAEVKSIEDDADIPVYPVIAVGVSYKF